MHRVTQSLFVAVVSTLFAANLIGCSSPAIHEHHHGNDTYEFIANAYSDRTTAVKQISDDKIYKVTLYSNQYPLLINAIHSWTLHIETAAGEIVENAEIRIHGGMPAHKHGYPTTPRVKQYLGNGDYLIEGIKFSMPGQWEMRINIKEEKLLRRDRVVFIIPV